MLLFFNNLPKKELGLDHIKGKDLTCENGIGKACYSAMRKLQRQANNSGAQENQSEPEDDNEEQSDGTNNQEHDSQPE